MRATGKVKDPDLEYSSITRVVPGKLVYVTSTEQPDKTYVLKPDKVVIQEKDGSLSPYRGEPFNKIGLVEGKTVKCKLNRGEPHVVVVEPFVESVNIIDTTSKAISQVALKAKNWIKGI